MLTVIEAAIVIAYMINSMLGMTLMAVYSIGKLLFSKKGDSIYRSFELMIMSLPMAYIGIAGPSMHQLLSWYNVFLVIFLVKIIIHFSRKVPFTKSAVISILVMLGCFFANMFWASDLGGTLAEIAQILVMMIPIIIVHTSRANFPIEREGAYELLRKYVDVCVATAIAMLVQYAMYYFLHRQIGIIHFTGMRRVQFYGLFRGASILPIYMGIGIVFLFIECFDKRINIERLIKIFIIFAAVVLNTSRTGLFTLMVVLAMVCIKYLAKRPSFKGIFIALLGFVGAVYAVNYITTLRSGLSGFLDANGRITTWENGIRIFGSSIKNILLGEGFSGGMWTGITKPHNLIIQTLAQCGIIVTAIVLVMLARYILENIKNPYVFMGIYIILSAMLVTDFYANAFTTVIFMLIDIYSGKAVNIESTMSVYRGEEYETGRKVGLQSN